MGNGKAGDERQNIASEDEASYAAGCERDTNCCFHLRLTLFQGSWEILTSHLSMAALTVLV
jgi:hypothetical protein